MIHYLQPEEKELFVSHLEIYKEQGTLNKILSKNNSADKINNIYLKISNLYDQYLKSLNTQDPLSLEREKKKNQEI